MEEPEGGAEPSCVRIYYENRAAEGIQEDGVRGLRPHPLDGKEVLPEGFRIHSPIRLEACFGKEPQPFRFLTEISGGADQGFQFPGRKGEYPLGGKVPGGMQVQKRLFSILPGGVLGEEGARNNLEPLGFGFREGVVAGMVGD